VEEVVAVVVVVVVVVVLVGVVVVEIIVVVVIVLIAVVAVVIIVRQIRSEDELHKFKDPITGLLQGAMHLPIKCKFVLFDRAARQPRKIQKEGQALLFFWKARKNIVLETTQKATP